MTFPATTHKLGVALAQICPTGWVWRPDLLIVCSADTSVGLKLLRREDDLLNVDVWFVGGGGREVQVFSDRQKIK